MGLDFAIDELYKTGWSPSAGSSCERHRDGRAYPNVSRVAQEFNSAGYDLTVRHIQLFGCFRAEWHDESGNASGAVVGTSEAEAAVYALAQLRRNMHAASVA